ncbi:hypothetical protein BGX31_005644 [Mortierella sp. GBA43]|nr:hypothetical protein BGX31_005644 [Mortierella sp. GBA43]
MMVEETMAARFGTSRLGFVQLMDGEENVTRLYSHSHTVDLLASTDGFMVPILDHAEYGFEDEDLIADASVPLRIESERDHVIKQM